MLKSNEDLVVDLMTFSPRGALCQAFVITAIEKYCADVIQAGPEKFDSAFMNGQAWVDVAVDTQARMKAFYGRHDAPKPEPEPEPKPEIKWRQTPHGTWIASTYTEGDDNDDGVAHIYVVSAGTRLRAEVWSNEASMYFNLDQVDEAKTWVESFLRK